MFKRQMSRAKSGRTASLRKLWTLSNITRITYMILWRMYCHVQRSRALNIVLGKTQVKVNELTGRFLIWYTLYESGSF